MGRCWQLWQRARNTVEKDYDVLGADAAKFRGTGVGHLIVIVGVALLQKIGSKMRTKSMLQFIRIVLRS